VNPLLADQYVFRDGLVDDLVRDLMGPGSDDEVLTDAPITAYVIGVLYPQSAAPGLDPELDFDEGDTGDEAAPADPAVSLAQARYPSSIGMSFAIDAAADPLTIEVTAAQYIPETSEAGPERPDVDTRRRHRDGPQRWRRQSISRSFTIDAKRPMAGKREPVADHLELFYRTRSIDGSIAVTVALLNTAVVAPGSVERDALSYFQPAIRVTGNPGASSVFRARPQPGAFGSDEDMRSYRLLYRHAQTYAVGHGCGTTWRVLGRGDDFIATSFTPTHELPLAISNPDIDAPCLSLELLADGARERVVEELRVLPALYESWIESMPLSGLGSDLTEIANEHLADCRLAAQRMQRGIDLLATRDDVWLAFRLANDAMLTVRSRADWKRADRPPEGPSRRGQKWYPFQLAFQLLCIEGIADPTSADRKLLDLLWFPTGGGKTEAYLGLVAFVTFLRRIRGGRDGGGVTALMRYTLRLLTIQQFERAAALICACELLRRKMPEKLGTERISLGLWVGGGGTPNKLRDAKQALTRIRAGAVVESGNPVQLTSCPWCGDAFDAWNYSVDLHGPSNALGMVIACKADDCEFRSGLPVAVVDQDVYAIHPTLVVATSDKFAGIAWREEAAALFNLDRHATPPPELIIQDELHLISGPRGTMAGLYEAAIDGTISAVGFPAKVIASTATIRRAGAQASALFSRSTEQFPPPGIDAGDSFFAVTSKREDKGTRLYVGLMAPGTSQATLLVRAYARLLQSAAALPGTPQARDPYYTLLGYFNSLRVLGGARIQVHNDVVDRLRLLEGDDPSRRVVDRVIELTSRESSSKIPLYLEELGKAVPDALDVVLATNMISVGVDIDRLGLMVVMGQPQGTAEYIQATSRVGRKFPGLVITLFNSGRSRDRSHYEAFTGYHAALYRQVEATSVTPWSPRARDRALHAALIASVRLRIPELRPNGAAGRVLDYLPEIARIQEEIVARARAISPADADHVASELKLRVAEWVQYAELSPQLVYWSTSANLPGLLVAAGSNEIEASPDSYPTLWSLRDVDQSTNLYLLR
jgi:hypothetical protein